MKKKHVLLVTVLFLMCSGFDGGVEKPESYFNFWVGKWDLTWQDGDGKTGKGTNEIYKTLGDKVIQENFEALEGQLKGFVGKSWSVYNPQTGEWKQTWVDNQGGYLDFIGKFEKDKKMFWRSFKDANNNEIQQRMVFYGITKEKFTWDWERSDDQGKTWKLQWRINYERMEESTR